MMNVGRLVQNSALMACLAVANFTCSSASAAPVVGQVNLVHAIAPVALGWHGRYYGGCCGGWGYSRSIYGGYPGWSSYYYGRPSIYYSSYRPYYRVAAYSYAPRYFGSYSWGSPYYRSYSSYGYVSPYYSAGYYGSYASSPVYASTIYSSPISYATPVSYVSPVSYTTPVYASSVSPAAYVDSTYVSGYGGYSYYSYPTFGYTYSPYAYCDGWGYGSYGTVVW